MDADCCNAVLETSGEYAPRVAYQQTENQRKLGLNWPQHISIEPDLQTMDKIIAPRGELASPRSLEPPLDWLDSQPFF